MDDSKLQEEVEMTREDMPIPAKTPEEVTATTWARVERSILHRQRKKDAEIHGVLFFS
jgi:hypothetical protein